LCLPDSGQPSAARPNKVVELMDDGGIVVLDDFTPCQSWPPLFEGRVDTLREEWLSDDRFAAVEALVAPDAYAVRATQRRQTPGRPLQEPVGAPLRRTTRVPESVGRHL